MSELAFIDACAEVGPRTVRAEDQPYSLEEYRADMKHFGIEEAVVYHSVAKEFDPATGNRMILEETAGDPRLHPQWVLLPPDTHELPPPEELVTQMRACGVRSARLCPVQHNYLLDEILLGDLFAVLEEARIPVFIEKAEATWPQLIQICSAHPRLPVVITRTGYRETRVLPGIWKRFQRLYVDTSILTDHCILEESCRRWGPHRLVYSSVWPALSPANAMALIGYATIKEEWKKAISSENLLRLLRGEEE